MRDTGDTDDGRIDRRKVLGALGGIAGASALGGGTSALLWDEEIFGSMETPNVLQAGALDLTVDWEVYYWKHSDQSPQLVSSSDTDDDGDPDQVDDPGPIVDLTDVKPGDVVEHTLSYHVHNNPGFVSMGGTITADSDNGITEPEDMADGELNGSDGDPYANAGLGLLGGGLLAGAVPDSLRDQMLEKAPSRKSVLKAAGAAGAGAAGLAAAGTAAAAPGDVLGTVTLPNHESTADGFFCGVGGAFDGTHYVTPKEGDGDCASNVIQIYDPPSDGDGQATLVSEKNIVDSNGDPVTISTNAWDPTRGQFWVTKSEEVYLLDLGDRSDGSVDAVATQQFTANPANFDLADGLAYDGANDALYYSGDVDDIVEHYDIATGTETARSPITPKDENGNTLGEISGVATGAPVNGRETLYVGQNPGPDDGNIYRVYADDGSFVSTFATGTDFRVEDITCDPVTYDSEAILVKDARASEYKAFEVETGTCPVGGTEPEPEPGDDGELDELMECVVWYDGDEDGDGDSTNPGNNFPEEITDGYAAGERMQFFEDLVRGDVTFDTESEDFVFRGSVRELFTLLEEGVLLSPGDDVADSFQGSDCYRPSTTHYLGVLCWLPRDIPGVDDNIVQTDRLEYHFGFDAIQCRHNVDSDGQPIDGNVSAADSESG